MHNHTIPMNYFDNYFLVRKIVYNQNVVLMPKADWGQYLAYIELK